MLFLWSLLVLTWLWGGLHMVYGQLWMLVLFCICDILLVSEWQMRLCVWLMRQCGWLMRQCEWQMRQCGWLMRQCGWLMRQGD